MALSVHVKLACLLVQLAMLLAASQVNKHEAHFSQIQQYINRISCAYQKVNADGAASYCDHGACLSPDMYCCGHNECCSYVVTTYYLWLVEDCARFLLFEQRVYLYIST